MFQFRNAYIHFNMRQFRRIYMLCKSLFFLCQEYNLENQNIVN